MRLQNLTTEQSTEFSPVAVIMKGGEFYSSIPFGECLRLVNSLEQFVCVFLLIVPNSFSYQIPIETQRKCETPCFSLYAYLHQIVLTWQILDCHVKC